MPAIGFYRTGHTLRPLYDIINVFEHLISKTPNATARAIKRLEALGYKVILKEVA